MANRRFSSNTYDFLQLRRQFVETGRRGGRHGSLEGRRRLRTSAGRRVRRLRSVARRRVRRLRPVAGQRDEDAAQVAHLSDLDDGRQFHLAVVIFYVSFTFCVALNASRGNILIFLLPNLDSMNVWSIFLVDVKLTQMKLCQQASLSSR